MKGREKPEIQSQPTDPAMLDIEAMGLRLLVYVHRRIRRFGWRDADPVVAEGAGAQDIAADAMVSLFGGSRQWDPAREPDPWKHVMSVANSMVSNLLGSADVRMTGRGVATDCVADDATPEAILLENERQSWGARAENLLLERIIEDEELIKMHDLAESEDILRPADVAARLGWDPKRVYRANERLQRQLAAVVAILRKKREEGEHD